MSTPSISQLFSALINPGFSAIRAPQAERITTTAATLFFNANPNFPDDVEYLTVTGSSKVWTEDAVNILNHRLPVGIKTLTREVVNTTNDNRTRLTTLFSGGQQYNILSLTIRIDDIDQETANMAPIFPLAELIIRPPPSPHSIQYDIRTPVSDFISSF